MNSLTCILCESTGIELKERISTKDISILYAKRAGVKVERFFLGNTIDFCRCPACGLKFYSPQTTGDGPFYDALQHYNGYYLADKAEYIEAANYIKITDEVLEVGCGEGLFTNYIHCKSYTGLEFSAKAIAIAEKKGLTILNEDLELHANRNNNKYDVVCYFQVLEHIDNPRKFIRDSLRCLKPGGVLLFAVPSEDSFINKAIDFYLNMPPHHISKWTDTSFYYFEKIFPLHLLEIYHEQLNATHKGFYLKTIINTKLRQLFHLKLHSIDRSISSKLIHLISAGIAFFLKLFWKPNHIIGQSVLVVYKKILVK